MTRRRAVLCIAFGLVGAVKIPCFGVPVERENGRRRVFFFVARLYYGVGVVSFFLQQPVWRTKVSTKYFISVALGSGNRSANDG